MQLSVTEKQIGKIIPTKKERGGDSNLTIKQWNENNNKKLWEKPQVDQQYQSQNI